MIKIRKDLIKLALIDIFIVVIFVLIFFTPPIKFLPHYTWILSMFGFLTLLDLKFRKFISFNYINNIKFWGYLLMSIVFLSISPIVHGVNDYTYTTLVIGIVLAALRSILALYFLYKLKKNDITRWFCEFFINACCVCVIFTIVFIVFPDFKEFWLNKVLVRDTIQTYYAYTYRYSVGGFAAFTESSTFSIASVICGYLIVKDNKISLKYVVDFMIVIIGCFFYGRISFFGIVIGLLIIVSKKQSIMKVLVVYLRIFLLSLALLLLLNHLTTINNEFLYWKNWAFAFIKQLFIDRKITDYSVTHMFNDMYWIPDFNTLLWGDGYYMDLKTGKYYMGTDVGFMRLILYTGIWGMVFAYGLMFFLYRKSYLVAGNDKQKKRLLILLLSLWIILEMKGDAYHRMIMIGYPLFLSFLCDGKAAFYSNEKAIKG